VTADAEALAVLADAIRRLSDAAIEEAAHTAVGIAIKRRQHSAPTTGTPADTFVRLLADHFPAEIRRAVRPACEEQFLDGLAEGVRRFVNGPEPMAAAYRAGLLHHLTPHAADTAA
jgi:hypothetical protein